MLRVAIEIPVNAVQQTGKNLAKYKIKLDSSIKNGNYKTTHTFMSENFSMAILCGLSSDGFSLVKKHSGKEQSRTFSGLSDLEDNYCYIENPINEAEHKGYFMVLLSIVPDEAV